MRISALRVAIAGFGLWIGGVVGAAAAEKALPDPFPATAAAAVKAGLRFGDFDAANDAPLNTGDVAWALVSFFDGKTSKQWLVHVELVSPTANEKKRIVQPAPLKLHSVSGRALEFKGEVAVIELQTWGPFTPGEIPKKLPEPKKARAGVNTEHLKLGFARGCSTIIRVNNTAAAATDLKNVNFGYRTEPFPPEQIAKGKQLVEAAQVSEEDERALAASFPAIYGFFNIALNSPGLQEILSAVVDIPLWSIVKSGGKVAPMFHFDGSQIMVMGANDSGSEDQIHFALPARLELNQKPALNFTLDVRSPRSPYASTAGILALYAHHPKNQEKRAIIQIVSAKRGS
jgi:hypothetical protein